MKTLTSKSLKILTFTGLFCLAIPLSIYGLWIHASNLGATQAERVLIFNTYFPDFLQGRYGTAFLSVFFCISAIALAILNLKLSGKFWKIFNIIILVFSILLLMLNLFSMM